MVLEAVMIPPVHQIILNHFQKLNPQTDVCRQLRQILLNASNHFVRMF